MGTTGLSIMGVIALVAIIFVIGTLLTQWAWNAFVPGVFGLPSIDLIQALALNVLVVTVRGFRQGGAKG